MTEVENLEAFRSNLSLIKLMKGDKAEEEFYNLMQKVKLQFGDLHLYMGEFYYEYAKFLIQKMEKNAQLFNAEGLPTVQDQNRVPEQIEENQYEQDSSEQAAPSQQNAGEDNQNVPIITEDKQQQKAEDKPEQQANQNQGQDDDFEVCASNLMCAIQIYQEELKRIQDGGEPNLLATDEVQRFITRCKSRLGDLYHLNENYQEAIAIYREVIELEEKKPGHESNRGLAQIHYMIATCYLYENKDQCEVNALPEYFHSIKILVNRIKEMNPEDCTQYELPHMGMIKVNRFPFLPKPTDSEETLEVKDVASCLLDKIEDTFQQIAIRKQYQQEVKKMKEKAMEATFKQVSSDVPVIKLGTFGNRKKKPLPEEQIGENKKQQKPSKKEQQTDKKGEQN